MKAIILCGGRGKKMFPFNAKWQKSCLPVGNIPNIVRIIEQLKRLGILDIHLLTDYHKKQVQYLLRDYDNIDIIDTKKDTIQRDLAYLCGHDNVIIHYGDVYASDQDIENLINAFQANGNALLVNDYKRSSDYICAMVESGYVKNIYGHPREHYVNAKISGVFALDKSIVKYIKYPSETFLNIPVGGMPNEEFYLEQCLMDAIEDGLKMQGISVQNSLIDMDFSWDILFANEKYCLEEVARIKENDIAEKTQIKDNTIVRGFLKTGENCVIGNFVIFEGNCIIGDNVIIDNGAIIGANCVIGSHSRVSGHCKINENTVIGKYCRIGFTAEVSGVIFDRVSIVHHSEIYGVVGACTDIAAGCQCAIVRFDDLENPNRVLEKIYTNKFSNAVFIGDNTRTGIGNIFLPGIKVGCNCALGPGLMIERDIKDSQLIFVKQEIIEKEWSTQRYGW